MPGDQRAREWLIEASPGETRAVLVENGAVAEIRLIRAAEAIAPGAVFGARLRKRLSGNRALVDLSPGEAHMQPIPPGLAEGGLVAVEVTRPALPEPGRMKLAHVRPILDMTASRNGLLSSAPAWVPTDAPVRTVARIPQELALDELMDAAVTGEVSFPGGLLTLERTRAGLVIDVDGTGSAHEINMAAARAAARVLRLYGIGGPVMIDFLSSGGKADRVAVAEAFDAAAKADPRPFERTAVSGYGLMQVIRTRPGPSVIDQLCGTRRNGWSDESLALRLLREAAHSRGAGVRQLTARPEIIAVLKGWPDLVEQAARLAGAPIELLADATVQDYGYVHAKPI